LCVWIDCIIHLGELLRAEFLVCEWKGFGEK